MNDTIIFTIKEIGRNKYAIVTKNRTWKNHNRECISKLEIFPEMTALTTYFNNSVNMSVLFEVE